MAKDRNDFLKFSAYSIKDLVTRKLAQDSNFTDEIYEGSNLAVLIDIFSMIANCVLYAENNAAAESMFADTQLYENISRLCKFIGYHPKGYVPASFDLILNSFGENKRGSKDRTLYVGTALDTGMTDSRGKKIYFSTVFDSGNENTKMDGAQRMTASFVNGVWKRYPTAFTASGSDYETFILDGVRSDSSREVPQYVGDRKILVVIESAGKFTRWQYDANELFIQAADSSFYDNKWKISSGSQYSSGNSVGKAVDPVFSKLYANDAEIYSVYLNGKKTYEIKFGNGIIGKKLNANDKVHVMYLDTNGPDGNIDLGGIDMSSASFRHDHAFFGFGDGERDLYRAFFSVPAEDGDVDNMAKVEESLDTWVSPAQAYTSAGGAEESVDDIRENAPQWFKSGNRLITKQDYEYFFRTQWNAFMTSRVIDIKCMNNWEYVTTFYRWLYNLGISPCEPAAARRAADPYKYLQQQVIVSQRYQYVDSADENNIYLWIKQSGSGELNTGTINNAIKNIKTLTTETYPLKPVDVMFDVSFTPLPVRYSMLVNGEPDDMSYLEITMTDNSIYSNTSVAGQVYSAISEYFYDLRCRFGQVVNYGDMLDAIYQINGVERVRTVFDPGEDGLADPYDPEIVYRRRYCDGLAFASWTSSGLIDIGDDLQVDNTSRALEQFQFPQLSPEAGSALRRKIKVIKKSMNTTNPIKF